MAPAPEPNADALSAEAVAELPAAIVDAALAAALLPNADAPTPEADAA